MWTQISSGHTCPCFTRSTPLFPGRVCSQSSPSALPALPSAPLRRSRGSSVATTATAAPANFRIPELPKDPPPYAANTAKYAIVEVGGHQLFVEEGRWYTVNRLVAAPGSKIQLRRVVGCKSDGQFSCGTPYLDNVVVEADVLEDLKGPKVTIFKYRAKKHYRKKTGHRQPLTKFLVTKIQPAA